MWLVTVERGPDLSQKTEITAKVDHHLLVLGPEKPPVILLSHFMFIYLLTDLFKKGIQLGELF